jgi:phosphodiesterase/alkaline phosphatase D-like protein
MICWVSEYPVSGVVEYGKTPELARKHADARVGIRHAVALTGLDPGSAYHYRVEGGALHEYAKLARKLGA